MNHNLSKSVKVFFRQDIKEVLMHPKEAWIKEPYLIIYGGSNENITVLSSGKNGIEYNKTYGYFHTLEEVIIYRCLYGQGLGLLQRNDEEGNAKEFRIIVLHPGVTFEVPIGFGHCLVNTSKNFLVMIDNAQSNPKLLDTYPIKQKNGFVYYVVNKQGEIGFEKNPNYSFHPQIIT